MPASRSLQYFLTLATSLRGAIIGCGQIGHKRAAALRGCAITVCCDIRQDRAEELAAKFPGVWPTTDWQAVVRRDDVDFVIVATPHDMLAPVAAAAAAAGKHVLVEKPGARCVAELDPVAETARRHGALVRVGFNHRYHRAFRKAREIFESGALGQMMFIRGRYGHGGRPGYEKEWRAAPERSGGGELIDQGAHLIDLSRWFLGDFTSVQGLAPTYVWSMPVEDNGFLLLETAGGQVAFLHASWTEWKNLFSFEIAGRAGKLRRGAVDVVPHVARNGPARNAGMGISHGRRFLGGGVRGFSGGHPASTPAAARHRGRAGRAPRHPTNL